jgi:hypothetical protein
MVFPQKLHEASNINFNFQNETQPLRSRIT